jgi:hypothetical protein
VLDEPRGTRGAAETEEWLALRQACGRLDARSREIVLLKLEGYTNDEIGKRFRLTPQRIGQILSAASQHLEESLRTSNRPSMNNRDRWPKRGNQNRDWKHDGWHYGMEYLSLAGIVLHELASVPEPDRATALENLRPLFQIKGIGHIWPHFVAAVEAAAKGERYTPTVEDWTDAEDLEDAA